MLIIIVNMLDNIVISLVNFNTNFLSLVTIYSIIVMIIINVSAFINCVNKVRLYVFIY